MKRKWLLLFGLALMAAAIAALRLLDKEGTDFTWGLAGGVAIGAAFSWFTERSGAR